MLTATDVAAQLGISTRAVYELANTGRLPCVRPTAGGRSVRFAETEVQEYIAQCRSIASKTRKALLASSLSSAVASTAGRQRVRKLLPASWNRSQADAFDRKESARLYALARGIEEVEHTIDEACRSLPRRAVGLDHLHFHDLRHSTASDLVSNGHSLFVVGKVLRHKSAASTQRYAHLHDEVTSGSD